MSNYRSNVQEATSGEAISCTLAGNRQKIEALFADSFDLAILDWHFGPQLQYAAFSVYFDTLIQHKKVNYMRESLQDLIPHELGQGTEVTPEDIARFYNAQGVSSQSATLIQDFNSAVDSVLSGSLVIFFEGWDKALAFQASNLEGRQITEPVSEPVVQGPRESTVESLSKNIGLLRTRVRTTRFKLKRIVCGDNLQNEVVYGYIEDRVEPKVLEQFESRIQGIEKVDILDVSYLEDWIEESSISPFPQCRFTERPDAAAANLMEGKIAVLANGSPTILLCPAVFVEFVTNSEDYYQRTVHASMIRILRIIAFVMALVLPSTYIAFSTFHPELLPSVLLLAILETREGIPFPAFVEALIMEFFFELLREAGIRLPRPVGSAVSIVGALVIGQAAIQAKIASPIMVIIVALTGIASFSIPQYSMAIALRILRFPLMVLATTLGGFGMLVGFLLILLHLTKLKALGIPYLSGLAPLNTVLFRDVVVRRRIKKLIQSNRKAAKSGISKGDQP
ncbi:spore germination protein [Paenibacillus sp. 1P07SE]|uniref:spore germination protein n=1 Tax=Paenibacillus sp. 1P07SE TaxID=3132209 RepID=UPI0039A6C3D6